jgi:hypothetical protein
MALASAFWRHLAASIFMESVMRSSFFALTAAVTADSSGIAHCADSTEV